jgi:DNA-binding ferritin-like protein
MPTTSTTAADFDTAQTETAQALRHLLADVFALSLKTKGFHWHVGGRHFREDHFVRSAVRDIERQRRARLFGNDQP